MFHTNGQAECRWSPRENEGASTDYKPDAVFSDRCFMYVACYTWSDARFFFWIWWVSLNPAHFPRAAAGMRYVFGSMKLSFCHVYPTVNLPCCQALKKERVIKLPLAGWTSERQLTLSCPIGLLNAILKAKGRVRLHLTFQQQNMTTYSIDCTAQIAWFSQSSRLRVI